MKTVQMLILSLATAAAAAPGKVHSKTSSGTHTTASSMAPKKSGSTKTNSLSTADLKASATSAPSDPLANVNDAFAACQLASNCMVVTGSNGQKTIAQKSGAGAQKDAAPAGPTASSTAHIKTYVSYSDSSIEWGCGAPGEMDPSTLVGQALDSGCKSTGCVENSPWTKQIIYTPMNTGNTLDAGQSGTLSIEASGFYDPTDRDNFFSGIQVLAGKGAQTQNETYSENSSKRDAVPAADRGLEARIDLPPGGSPVATASCIATKQFTNMSVSNFGVVDGQPFLNAHMDIGVSVELATPSNGFCAIIDPIGASLGGTLPGVGSAVAAFFGLLPIGC